MGIETAAFHHPSRCWVDLGKGPWARLDWTMPLLSLVDEAILEWGILDWSNAPRDSVIYTTWVCGRVQAFLRSGRWESVLVLPPAGPLEGQVLTDYQDPYGELVYGRAGVASYRNVGSRHIEQAIDYRVEARQLLGDDLDLLLALTVGIPADTD